MLPGAAQALLPAQAVDRSGRGPYGPLGAPDDLGLQLPDGFTARVVATGETPVAGTDYVWHVFPDGGAVFPTRGRGWIYVSNSEHPSTGQGGASALRFDRSGDVVDAYRVLEGTQSNCAGGATPWKTWVSGEEHAAGRLWECDPTGARPGRALDALGVFKHEAAAFDPDGERAYLTEDEADGRFYRFTPTRWPDLDAGRLEVAAVDERGRVTWHDVPDPTAEAVPTRAQVEESFPFDGGEGITYHRGSVFFTTKGDDRVWRYDTKRSRLTVHYDGTQHAELPLHGVDNINVTPRGDLVVAEDGGDLQLVLLTTAGVVAPLLQVNGQDGSELTGPAFSPDGRRLYFSSQRGGGGAGLTYEVSGPFARRR
jgi:secreted PhoX family phosphatase